MSQTLLQELTNNDLDWLETVGQQVKIAQQPILQGQPLDTLYLILEGSFSVCLPQATQNPLDRAFAALEDNSTLEQNLYTLQSGDLIGEELLLKVQTATTVKPQTPSRLLAIPKAPLQTKLQQDISFAARLYRSLARILSDRLLNFKQNRRASKFVPVSQERDILLAFGELHDSDLDWMLTNGECQHISAGTLVIEQGRPVEAFYVILEGAINVTVFLEAINPLDRAFAALGTIASPNSEQLVATLQPGEFIGEFPFGEPRLASNNIRAERNSLVLAIPAPILRAKLHQDDGWTARFERVVAILAARRLQAEIQRLGYSRRYYSSKQRLDPNITYDDELDFETLDNLNLAGTRFNWMRDRLRNGCS